MLCFRETAFGRVGVQEQDGVIVHVYLPGRSVAAADGPETPLLREAFEQLEAYFSGRLKIFDLPLRMEGTPFMRRVWEALRAVPYGVTASYGDIAKAIGNPKACRAVGMANNHNPISIVVPCHRIVGSDGGLVGYGGGLDMKRRLLDLERAHAD